MPLSRRVSNGNDDPNFQRYSGQAGGERARKSDCLAQFGKEFRVSYTTHYSTYDGGIKVDAVLMTSGTFAYNNPVLAPPVWSNTYPPFDLRMEYKAEIANPMLVQPITYQVLDTATSKQLFELQDAYRGAEYFTQSDLDSYADVLVRIAKELSVRQIDIMLVPLRGGWKPSIQLQVMNKVGYPLFPFVFTAGSQGRFQKENIELITERLREFHGKAALRIGVIDAAISGHSAKALAELLLVIKREFAGQAWHVCFDLLYSDENRNQPYPAESDVIPGMSKADLTFERQLRLVPSLLVEDWDEGIGFSLNNGQCIYKTTGNGTLLLRTNDNRVGVYRSSELARFIDHLIANSASESMLSDPLLELKRTL